VTSAMPTSPGPASPGPGDPSPGGRWPGGRLVMTPARRAAILIGVPIVFLIFITGGLSVVGGAAAGSFPVTESVAIPNGKLTMNLGGGDATLRGSDLSSATARVIGTVTYHITRPSLRVTAGDISLSCPKVNLGNCGLNATVDVPAGIALNVQTGGGDLTASGLTDGGTLATDGGNLTVRDITRDLILSSGGGDVRASQVNGQAITITADGGNVSGSAIAVAGLTISSGGGDVTLTLTSSPRNLTVHSDGGTVTIVVPHGQYIVNATADGGTVNDFSSAPGAANVISVSSGGGDIALSQS
jgi:hypothetical protein